MSRMEGKCLTMAGSPLGNAKASISANSKSNDCVLMNLIRDLEDFELLMCTKDHNEAFNFLRREVVILPAVTLSSVSPMLSSEPTRL
mmetsp:Transcript_25517/g.67694  ORF Transcript_25517/g.67694 Transcript_25517/m.67694 type:complete len:87 (-) Transcript_25517:488-748(-)